MEKKILYFLCTGNSCRSQMAEAFGHKHLSDQFDVYSAGIEAHGLNPNAIKAMDEVGIDIRNQTSDTIDTELLNRADYVVTLCGDANDKCPITPPHVTRWHWGFDDPSSFQGTHEEKLEKTRKVRDKIKVTLSEWVKNVD